jgi:hypothetical protein
VLAGLCIALPAACCLLLAAFAFCCCCAYALAAGPSTAVAKSKGSQKQRLFLLKIQIRIKKNRCVFVASGVDPFLHARVARAMRKSKGCIFFPFVLIFSPFASFAFALPFAFALLNKKAKGAVTSKGSEMKFAPPPPPGRGYGPLRGGGGGGNNQQQARAMRNFCSYFY